MLIWCQRRPEKGVRSPGTRLTVVSYPVGGTVNNESSLGHLEDQTVL